QSNPVRNIARSRRSPRTADRTGFRPFHHEPVPVRPVRPEPADLHVNRVRKLRPRYGLARPGDLREALILGNLPTHRDRSEEHTAMLFQRLWRQPRPDHESIRPWITRGNAQ